MEPTKPFGAVEWVPARLAFGTASRCQLGQFEKLRVRGDQQEPSCVWCKITNRAIDQRQL